MSGIIVILSCISNFRTHFSWKKQLYEENFIHTDTGIYVEFLLDPEFKEEKSKCPRLMMPYQINKELMKGSKAYIMHDMPIHRGYEISAEMINSPQSIIFQQSENRLHTAKAILLKLLG